MRVRVVMVGQDDPKKCTAARMVRLGTASESRSVSGAGIVLDPFSPRVLLPRDGRMGSVCAVDCSWRLAGAQFGAGTGASGRRLPPLLAGNPVNYSRASLLSTAEAVAAALYITGSREAAMGVLSGFRWGHTFYELNAGPLEEYSRARDEADVERAAQEFGLPAGPPRPRRQRRRPATGSRDRPRRAPRRRRRS
ncbi:MAG: DUF367 family protein [Nitrosopumilus sp.]|nr:DUF367 family protein [Nitrosopumilus sp.]MDA7944650.1 DUF367 family protein [Nitrosopumilus sp.]MDA7954591.1 DUF367 family protein [Nitrosopumilus sp.]MDA7973330.1 DUF367 family protein [Nitrosopumilus sp.]MDA7996381.1 DUF367 family protein [Nitrosopumilus sp.]